ncbi:hypothetical protein LCGC14_0893550 [marine sediment metagenome]|uniref:Uncharacterized protein n=1 Tax=marine sediment metagenome TaxID=412755 RepID=A0A0F9RHR2_9ZZZZ
MNKITPRMYSNWKSISRKDHDKEWKHESTGIKIKFSIRGSYVPITKTNYAIYEVELLVSNKLFTLYGDSVSGPGFNKRVQMRDKIVLKIKKFMIKTNKYDLPKFNIEKHKTWKRL